GGVARLADAGLAVEPERHATFEHVVRLVLRVRVARRRRAVGENRLPQREAALRLLPPHLRQDERAEEPERVAHARRNPSGRSYAPPGTHPMARTRTPSGPGTRFRITPGATRRNVPASARDFSPATSNSADPSSTR